MLRAALVARLSARTIRNGILGSRTMSTSATPEEAAFPILKSVPDVRAWRKTAFQTSRSVGFVPTMGALHEGHLELVRRSLRETDLTVCSIFVNPAQFAPTEDLSTYPRTLESDLKKLASIEVDGKRVNGLFLPAVTDLYPDGIEQDVSKQKGTFVDVKGYSQEMEGQSRPTFFRGVATVVTKLFNIVQPDYAFFGQKDIQQCLILRRMVADLHMPYPPSPTHLRVVPTVRDFDNVALSSRNAYLTPAQRQHAPVLYAAMSAAQRAIIENSEISEAGSSTTAASILQAAQSGFDDFLQSTQPSSSEKVEVELDYIKVNDPITLRPMEAVRPGQPAVLSGAIRIGQTRLIDNFLVNITL